MTAFAVGFHGRVTDEMTPAASGPICVDEYGLHLDPNTLDIISDEPMSMCEWIEGYGTLLPYPVPARTGHLFIHLTAADAKEEGVEQAPVLRIGGVLTYYVERDLYTRVQSSIAEKAMRQLRNWNGDRLGLQDLSWRLHNVAGDDEQLLLAMAGLRASEYTHWREAVSGLGGIGGITEAAVKELALTLSYTKGHK
tara:strand:- start:34412 stop:34996 length:585 start_codon:yes stop_codon:yes gene_type:complete